MNQYKGNYGDRTILTFVYLYSVGRFIKEYGTIITEKIPAIEKYPWRIYFTTMVIFFVIVSFTPSLISRGVNYFARAYNTIGLTSFSILFFYCFKNLSIQNKWINVVARSTFAIYLIHGNNIVTYHRWIYNSYTNFGIAINSIHLKIIYLLGSAFIICFGCILIDQIRLYLFKYLGIDWSTKKIDAFVSNKYKKVVE